jgi:hypothetical protein
MIKKCLPAILLFVSICSYSQENKNKFMINGHMQYSHYGLLEKPSTSTDEHLDLVNNGSGGINFGYFLSTNFAIGISGSVSNFAVTTKSRTNNSAFEYGSNYIEKGCGIFARYNHAFPNSKFGFFLQLSSLYYWGDVNDNIPYLDPNGNLITVKHTTKNTAIATTFNPGVIYFINNKFSVESALGSIYYASGKSVDDKNYNEKFSDLSADFYLNSINLGFSYYFGGKKAESIK